MDLYLDTLAFTANIVAPIFFIVFLGLILKRIGIINDGFVNTSSKLVFNVTLPILIFMAISRTHFDQVFNLELMLFLLISTLISFTLLWWLAARWIKDGRDLGVFIQGAFRSNYGIIGLAISYNLFSDSGLAQGAILLALVIPTYNVLSIIALTLPLRNEASGGYGKAMIAMLKNPLIIAVALALPISLYNIELPSVLQKTGQYFANMTLPLALLSIGGALSLKSLRSTSSLAGWATLTKLMLMPLFIALSAWAIGFRGQDLTMLMILAGCPTAAASFVMAKSMGGNAELAANIIITTTLGSVFSLSAAIYLFRLLAII